MPVGNNYMFKYFNALQNYSDLKRAKWLYEQIQASKSKEASDEPFTPGDVKRYRELKYLAAFMQTAYGGLSLKDICNLSEKESHLILAAQRVARDNGRVVKREHLRQVLNNLGAGGLNPETVQALGALGL